MTAAASVLALALVGSAAAASYPAGGSTFSGSAEGWAVKSATCTVPLGLCSASGAYDGNAGNPAGSFGEKTNVTLNVGSLFNAAVVAESPDFTVSAGGSGSINLQRQFTPGGLLTLSPSVKYTALLIDKNNGNVQAAVSESINGTVPFATRGGPVTLVAGHTYAIRIESEVNSTVASIGLLGESVLRFDNVVLTDSAANNGENGSNGGNGNNGGNGGNGANGISDSALARLAQSSLVGPAVLKGNRIFVKAKCPAAVKRSCSNALLGLLKKGKAATARRRAKLAPGKTKRLILTVKPKARSAVAKKSKLLFKESVKAGSAKATFFKRLRLVRGS